MLNFAGEALIRKVDFDANGKLNLELLPLKAGMAFNFVWHPAPSTLQREYLAIGMAAITSNRRVFCTLPDTDNPAVAIIDFGLVKE